MPRARSKVVEIEFFRVADIFTVPFDEWPAWLQTAWNEPGICGLTGSRVLVNTPEGQMIGDQNDVIIFGTRGEIYPCKPGPFSDKYEVIGDDSPQVDDADKLTKDYCDNVREPGASDTWEVARHFRAGYDAARQAQGAK